MGNPTHDSGEHTAIESPRSLAWAIGLLVIILAILLVILAIQYRALRRDSFIAERESWFAAVMEHHGPLGANDVSLISPWMTFDYVNHLFNLPPNYFSAELSISDEHYPKITINTLAKEDHETASAALAAVESAVRAYFGANVPKTI